ncbi:MAG TPA: sigma-54 dependent transcriptional regulator [Acidisarcina sp.]
MTHFDEQSIATTPAGPISGLLPRSTPVAPDSGLAQDSPGRRDSVVTCCDGARKAAGAESRSVLVVDDEPGIRTALLEGFRRGGWTAEGAADVREAIAVLAESPFSLVVTDMRMPDGDGMEVLRAARESSPGTAVILLTAFGSVPDAVQSMRGGAVDYLTKPISFEQLDAAAARVMRRSTERPETAGEAAAGPALPSSSPGANARPPAAVLKTGPASAGVSIVGRAPALIQALRRARAAAGTSADVLLEAESGTGKELLARFVHEQSDRARRPFIAVNCAAVPEHLLESELFGHARGAFTGATAARAGKFELANGGTLLLDEIGDMPLHLQPKLLRALQEREFERLGETRPVRVDIRVIATTNASLMRMVEQGRFRSDLFYRLNVIPLSLPALRQRREDIPLLASYFAAEFAREAGLPIAELSLDFIDRLETHSWPGNVRELGNFMRRVLSLNPGVTLHRGCFDREFPGCTEVQDEKSGWGSLQHPSGPQTEVERKPQSGPRDRYTDAPGYAARDSSRDLSRSFEAGTAGTRFREIERLHLERTLALADGNRTHAAEMLGISLRTVRNKIKEYGLPPRRYA